MIKQTFRKSAATPKPVATQQGQTVDKISPWSKKVYSAGLAPSTGHNAPKTGAKHYLRVLPALEGGENWFLPYNSIRVFNDPFWAGELAFPWKSSEIAGLMIDQARKIIQQELGVEKISKKGKPYLALPENAYFLQPKPRVAVQVIPVKSSAVGSNEVLKIESQECQLLTLAMTGYVGATQQAGSVLMLLEEEVDENGEKVNGDITDLTAGHLVCIESVPKGAFHDYLVVASRNKYPLIDDKGNGLKLKDIPNVEEILNGAFILDEAVKYATEDDVCKLLRLKLDETQLLVLKQNEFFKKYASKLNKGTTTTLETEEEEEAPEGGEEPF